ncbi:MAG: hypothetical protein HS115_02105 [Spirochaetales bacterium]|nr:hypothetical protein [Spirochaetales bacterium]
MIFIRFCLFTFFSFFTLAGSPGNIEESLRLIEDAYPRSDYVGGSFTVIFAAMSLSRGLSMSDNERLSLHERHMGQALTILGAVRLIDGISRFFLDPYSVQGIRSFRQRGEDPAVNLKSWASNARLIRFARAHMVMVTGLIYLNLAASGRKDYADLPETGAFLVALALYQYGKVSPEEEAWQRLQPGDADAGSLKWSFFALPDSGGVAVQISF